MSLSGFRKDSLNLNHYGSTDSFNKAATRTKTKRPVGPLTAKANAAGLTLHAFSVKHKADKDLTGRQARFYLNVIEPRKKR